MRALKSNLLYFILICFSALLLSCGKDDDNAEEGSDVERVEISDAAFGEYLFKYHQTGGVVEEINENEEKQYYLYPDKVKSIEKLSFAKTDGQIEKLKDYNLETAEIYIKDLSEIAYFTGLKTLTLTRNHIEQIDLSKLENLEVLQINRIFLNELDLSKNKKLTRLRYRASSYAENNQKLTTIDLSNNPELEHVLLNYHLLEEIDVSNNTKLEYLNLSANPGPDGDIDADNIVIPKAIYDQLETADGVIADDGA